MFSIIAINHAESQMQYEKEIRRMDYIYGPGGTIIGSTCKSGSTTRGEHLDIYDANGQYVGWIDDDGTFASDGYQISTSKMPALLLKSNQDGN